MGIGYTQTIPSGKHTHTHTQIHKPLSQVPIPKLFLQVNTHTHKLNKLFSQVNKHTLNKLFSQVTHTLNKLFPQVNTHADTQTNYSLRLNAQQAKSI